MPKFLLGLVIGIFVGAGSVLAGLAIIGLLAMNTARDDARDNSVSSTLQTMRGQVELFKIQHGDIPPAQTALAAVLMGKTNAADTDHPVATGTLGPYVQSFPVNAANMQSAVGTSPSKTIGWVYTVKGEQYTIQAVNKAGDGVLSY